MEKKTLISIDTFCSHYKVKDSFIKELEDNDLIEIYENQYIDETNLPKVEKMARFYRDMSINVEGIDVIFNLLERVEILQQQISHLKTRLKLYEDL